MGVGGNAVGVFHFFAVRAVLTGVRALVLEMEGHVGAHDAEATSGGAWLQEAGARFEMLEASFIGVNLGAVGITAFKFESLEILFDHPMHITPLNSFVSLTFLWTMIIIFLPRINTISTKNRLAPRALLWISDNIRADWTNKKVRSISRLFIRFI